MNWSIVWVIMGWWGYPQNTGVLFVLVIQGVKLFLFSQICDRVKTVFDMLILSQLS